VAFSFIDGLASALDGVAEEDEDEDEDEDGAADEAEAVASFVEA